METRTRLVPNLVSPHDFNFESFMKPMRRVRLPNMYKKLSKWGLREKFLEKNLLVLPILVSFYSKMRAK